MQVGFCEVKKEVAKASLSPPWFPFLSQNVLPVFNTMQLSKIEPLSSEKVFVYKYWLDVCIQPTF
jgi:hypothetical protein